MVDLLECLEEEGPVELDTAGLDLDPKVFRADFVGTSGIVDEGIGSKVSKKMVQIS